MQKNTCRNSRNSVEHVESFKKDVERCTRKIVKRLKKIYYTYIMQKDVAQKECRKIKKNKYKKKRSDNDDK